MKFTLSWLKDHLDTDASLGEIVERLTAIGLEVEGVDDKSSLLAPFVIARVLTAEQHPERRPAAGLIRRHRWTAAPVQVVCGAPNARAGMVGAFAPPGTYIPGIDMTLGVGTIRGVESHGMMCSASASWSCPTSMTASSTCPRMRRSARASPPMPARRSGDRDQPDAEPARRDRRLRHRARPRRRRARQADRRRRSAGRTARRRSR